MITKGAYMDIVSLSRQGYSCREIARQTGIDRRTVRKYLKEQALPIYKKIHRKSKLENYKPLIEGWLSQDNFRATRIYDLLQIQGFSGSYDIVHRYVATVKKKRDTQAYVRFETMPGQQAQVDFGDFKIVERDGTTRTIYAFIMTLGYSRHMYVEFIERCTLPNFLACHQNAFGFFGGVPAEILYDNMKNVVVKRVGNQVIWTPAFESFMLHYGVKPMATPPYAPWVKGKVERPIDYIRERFWRGYGYQNIIKANDDIKEWLRTTAWNRMHGTHRQKVCDRFEAERSYLSGLPAHPYDLSLRYERLVQKDCQISFDGNRYVLPHELVGKRIVLRVKDDLIRVFDDDRIVTVYRIPPDKGQTLAHPQFYERLKADRQINRLKYRKPFGKAKATRGLLFADMNVDVMRRSLAVYEEVTL